MRLWLVILIAVLLVGGIFISTGEIAVSSGTYTRDSDNPIITDATGETQLLVVDGVYHLFYNGYPSIAGCSVGHATASDPLGVFTPESNNVIRVGGHGGMGILMDPATHEPILKSETELGIGGLGHTPKYWMFFSNEPGIFIATNADLYGAWSYRTTYNPVLEVTPGAWDSHRIGYNGIVVIEEDGIFKMLYHADSGDGKHEIGLATSTNLRDWVKYEGNPVMANTIDDPDWRCKPQDIWKEGDEYCMVYVGLGDGTKERLFKAYSIDLIDWTRDGVVLAEPIGSEFSISDFGIYKTATKEIIFYEAGGHGVPYGVYRMWRDLVPPDPPPPDPSPVDYQVWDYYVTSMSWTTLAGLEAQLDTLGYEGWELVAIIEQVFIFKRLN